MSLSFARHGTGVGYRGILYTCTGQNSKLTGRVIIVPFYPLRLGYSCFPLIFTYAARIKLTRYVYWLWRGRSAGWE